MSEYAIITQNDESAWEDIKGEVYHYPNTYTRILTRGCKVIYYKGSLKNKRFEKERLSNEPHYFGHAEIGDSVVDPISQKGDLFCEILKYHEFGSPVPIKIGHEYIEQIPETRKRNYWRFAVREIQKEIYQRIIDLSGQAVVSKKRKLPSLSGLFESTRKEGKKKVRFSTYYERNPINRQEPSKYMD